MKHSRKLLSVLAIGVFLASHSADAQGVPTVDNKNILQVLQVLTEAKAQLKEEILQNVKLDDQTVKLIQQIQTLQAQYDALTKGLSLQALNINPQTFLSDILPSWGDLTSALTSAQSGNWGGVLASGQVGTVQTATYVDNLFKKMGLSSATVSQLTQSTSPEAARIGNSANTSAFVSVAAEESAAAATESLTRLDGFAGQIATTTNIKEAIDLNTAATVELGVALANIWSAESVQMANAGNMGVMDAATAAEEEKFLKVVP